MKIMNERIRKSLEKAEKEGRRKTALLPIRGSVTEFITDKKVDKMLRLLEPKLIDGIKADQ